MATAGPSAPPVATSPHSPAVGHQPRYHMVTPTVNEALAPRHFNTHTDTAAGSEHAPRTTMEAPTVPSMSR